MSNQSSKPIWPAIALLAILIGGMQLHAIVGPNTPGAVLVVATVVLALLWFVWVGWIAPALRFVLGTTRRPNPRQYRHQE